MCNFECSLFNITNNNIIVSRLLGWVFLNIRYILVVVDTRPGGLHLYSTEDWALYVRVRTVRTCTYAWEYVYCTYV